MELQTRLYRLASNFLVLRDNPILNHLPRLVVKWVNNIHVRTVCLEENGESVVLEDHLPSPDAGPEAAYARSVLLEELDAALEDLPEEQRDVFVAHEIEGRSFKELSEATGVSVNTLLSRKRYAVLQLRRRLQAIYDEFGKN